MKKNIYAAAIAAVFLLLPGQGFCDQATVDASLAITIKEHPNTTDNPKIVSGTYEEKNVYEDVYLEPTIYPEFYNDNSENPNCAKTLSLKSRWTATSVNPDGHGGGADSSKYETCGTDCLSSDCNGASCDFSGCAAGKRQCQSDGYGCKNVYLPCTQDGEGDLGINNPYGDSETHNQVIPGLRGEIVIPKGYLQTSKVLFTWTVRVIGYKKTLAVWPFLCHPHHGTSYQRFPAGQVKTRLYVKGSSTNQVNGAVASDNNYAAMGQEAQLTIPSVGTSSISNPGDPTISGSFLLTKDDFSGGRLPIKIKYQVRWYNPSSMRIMALKEERNLVVMVIPVTEIKEEE